MTEFRVSVRNVVLSQHWPLLTRKDIHKYNYTKKNSVCWCAMLCSHNIDHLWHGEVQKCHPVQWLTATQNIHFCVPVIVKFSHYLIYTSLIPGYTRHQGRVGSAPSWGTNLPVGMPAPKDHDSWVSSPSAGSNVLDPSSKWLGSFSSDLPAHKLT